MEPTDTFCIDFETHDPKTGKPHAGFIKATQVTITEIIMDSDDVARIDLADHKLYPKLQRYVSNNKR